jgi:hypothetical protein
VLLCPLTVKMFIFILQFFDICQVHKFASSTTGANVKCDGDALNSYAYSSIHLKVFCQMAFAELHILSGWMDEEWLACFAFRSIPAATFIHSWTPFFALYARCSVHFLFTFHFHPIFHLVFFVANSSNAILQSNAKYNHKFSFFSAVPRK